MTSRQENKLNMYLAIIVFLNAKADTVTVLPKYAEFFGSFNSGVTNIKSLAEEQMFDKSGVHKNKKQLKLALAILAADASRKLTAYAKFSNMPLLLSEISFSESKLKYANSGELREYSQGIYDRAQSHLKELETYGITADTQIGLLAAIAEFTEFIPQPRIVRASGKRFTTEIAEAFKQTDTALGNIDTDVEIIKLKSPNFYKEYKSVRKIIPLGKGSVAIKGRVLDALTKEPIKNVSIVFTIKENGDRITLNGNGAVTKKTAKKGGFIVKTIPNGLYDVSLSKNGYTSQKTIIAVTTGELAKFDIELLKN